MKANFLVEFSKVAKQYVTPFNIIKNWISLALKQTTMIHYIIYFPYPFLYWYFLGYKTQVYFNYLTHRSNVCCAVNRWHRKVYGI